MCSLRVLCFQYLNMSQLFRVLHNVSTILRCLQYVMVTVQGITQCVHSIAVPTQLRADAVTDVWFNLNHPEDDLDFTYNGLTLTFFYSHSSSSFDLFELT